MIIGKDTNIARQGDVMLEKVDGLPEGLTEKSRDEHGHIVLAFGESSGHRHAIRDQEVQSFVMDSAEREANGLSAECDYILVGGSGAVLNHEYVTGEKADHEPVSLAPGAYKVVGQREYQPDQVRRAVD